MEHSSRSARVRAAISERCLTGGLSESAHKPMANSRRSAPEPRPCVDVASDFTLVFRFLCDAAAGPEGDTSARMLPLRATCNLPPAGVTSFEDDRLLLD